MCIICKNKTVNIRQPGSLTVEAAVIYSLAMFIIIGIIKLSLFIHDAAISGILNEYCYLKEDNIAAMYYDVDSGEIDVREIVNSTAYNIFTTNREEKIKQVRDIISQYQDYAIWGKDSGAVKGRIKKRVGIKNGTIVRGTHILINHGERIFQ